MMDKKINDLLSFSVFFLINELVGLKFHGELETWNDGFTKGTIQIHSVITEIKTTPIIKKFRFTQKI